MPEPGLASFVSPADATSNGNVRSPDRLQGQRNALGAPTHPVFYQFSSYIRHRCIRQTMLNISRAENWRDKHNIMYGDRKDIKGDYSELLSRSTFCFVLPG